MHAADAAGRKDLDARHVGNNHGRCDGRCTVLASGAQNGQIAAGGLGDCSALLAEVLDLLGGQAGLQAAADDGDGSGHCAVFADDAFDLQSGLNVLRIGHTVGNDGRFERDNGLALCDGLCDLGLHVKIFIQHDENSFITL